MGKKQYVVIGESERFTNSFCYINRETKSPREIWHTMRPFKLNPEETLTSPKYFDNKSEAVLFKKHANADEKQTYNPFPWKWTVLDREIFERNYSPELKISGE